jgi:acyl carrier protein
MLTDYLGHVLAAIRHVDDTVPLPIDRTDSLVLNLGFDSMKMTLLSLALENELGRAIALDGWIASHADPNELTVGSLCSYLELTLTRNEPATAAE